MVVVVAAAACSAALTVVQLHQAAAVSFNHLKPYTRPSADGKICRARAQRRCTRYRCYRCYTINGVHLTTSFRHATSATAASSVIPATTVRTATTVRPVKCISQVIDCTCALRYVRACVSLGKLWCAPEHRAPQGPLCNMNPCNSCNNSCHCYTAMLVIHTSVTPAASVEPAVTVTLPTPVTERCHSYYNSNISNT